MARQGHPPRQLSGERGGGRARCRRCGGRGAGGVPTADVVVGGGCAGQRRASAMMERDRAAAACPVGKAPYVPRPPPTRLPRSLPSPRPWPPLPDTRCRLVCLGRGLPRPRPSPGQLLRRQCHRCSPLPPIPRRAPVVILGASVLLASPAAAAAAAAGMGRVPLTPPPSAPPAVAAAGELPTAADYVVVGGGTAGCVVAARLCAALPAASVVLVERGPPRSEATELKVRAMGGLHAA